MNPSIRKSSKKSGRVNSATPPMVARGPKRKFQNRLLKWYSEFGRDLPWRRTSDPYKILVSEVMLQQPQGDRVIPKYHEFLEYLYQLYDEHDANIFCIFFH